MKKLAAVTALFLSTLAVASPSTAEAGMSGCYATMTSTGVVKAICTNWANNEVVRYAGAVKCRNSSGAEFWRYGPWRYSPGTWSYIQCASNESRLGYRISLSTW